MKAQFSALVLRVFLEIILECRSNGQQQNKNARSVTLCGYSPSCCHFLLANAERVVLFPLSLFIDWRYIIRYSESLRAGRSGDRIESKWGTAVAQWLRCCATNRKVPGSIPDGVGGIFIHVKSFRGVDSASNRNEYQEHFVGVKAAGA